MLKANTSVEESTPKHSKADSPSGTETHPSVVSRVLKSDVGVLEPLIQAYDLTEDLDASGVGEGDKWYKTGPWDKGHWSNRQ
jgi:hypothetical protein